MNNPVKWVDPSGLNAVDAMQDFGGGVRTGFTQHFQNLWQAVNNPINTLLSVGQSVVSNPAVAVANMHMNTNPVLNTMSQVHRYVVSYQSSGFYGLGVQAGTDLGQASTTLAAYGLVRGLGWLSVESLLVQGKRHRELLLM